MAHEGSTYTVDERSGNGANTRINLTGCPHDIAAGEGDDGAAITPV